MVYLAGIDEARFKRPVVPGDVLMLEARIERIVRSIGSLLAARVEGQLAAEAKLMAALRV
jgi:3-hydroxyacyl-[acyl-carrier-protein] dehydratase (EC 4.2.1.-)